MRLRFSIFLTLLILLQPSLLAQVVDEPKQDDTSEVNTPSSTERYEIDGVKVKYPKGWRVRKAVSAEGVVIEGPHIFEVQGRASRFGVVVGKGPHPNMDIDSFIDALKDILDKNNKELLSKLTKMETSVGEETLKLKASNIGGYTMKKVMHGEHATYQGFVKSGLEVNGDVIVSITHSVFYLSKESQYSIAVTYPESQSKRFRKIADWLIENVTIE